MTKQHFILFVLGLCMIVVSGCATLQEMIQAPKVTYQDMKLKDLSLFEGTMVFSLMVDNPNPIGAVLNDISYDLKLDNKDFIEGVLDKGITLKAGGKELMEIPITVNFMKLFKSAADFIKKDEIPYNISGAFRIHIFSIPYRASGKLPIPKLPHISLKNIDVEKLSLSGAKLLFNLNLKNNNAFAVALKGLDYGIVVGGKELLSGKTTEAKNIGKNGQTSLTIPLNLNFLDFGQSVYNVFKKSSTDYELKGNMIFDVPKIGTKTFPFTQSGRVNIKK